MADLPLPDKCQEPGCGCGGRLILHSRCHPEAPTWVILDRDVALVVCSVCGNTISGLRVTGLVRGIELPPAILDTKAQSQSKPN